MVEAGHVSMSRAVKQDRAVVGTMGRGRGRACCLDRNTFQEMAQALPREPSSGNAANHATTTRHDCRKWSIIPQLHC